MATLSLSSSSSSSLSFSPSLLSSPPLNRNLPSWPMSIPASLQLQLRYMPVGVENPHLKIRPMVAAVRRNPDVVGIPNSVPVRVAYELLQAGHRYLDVRTEEEFSIGHAIGAINVPYMLKFGNGLTNNPKFLEEVSSHFRKHDEILIGCQSGKRSLMAATDLLSAGFTGVTDIAGGFSAWTQTGLPTE
ncbi:thiosulfate sulfurtransferase 16, chloroplastic-like isoform X2 [Magnolia sinica]|uniref:thiosulfate sulfurtransferase 16, chloroplastic-like isoform X2 n=1 Tax=Magnolia sinica TaxID=86752 RepID=UPI0026583EAB|nr:thiosulfate sulfurtransferase 16, chloroplastic-like isoform X2 [Magnolia sinica]